MPLTEEALRAHDQSTGYSPTAQYNMLPSESRFVVKLFLMNGVCNKQLLNKVESRIIKGKVCVIRRRRRLRLKVILFRLLCMIWMFWCTEANIEDSYALNIFNYLNISLKLLFWNSTTFWFEYLALHFTS